MTDISDNEKDTHSIGEDKSMKEHDGDLETSVQPTEKRVSFVRLLFKYEVIVNSLVLTLVSSSNSFFFPTLEEHMKKSLNIVNLEVVALEFFLGSSVYVASTLVIGRVLGEIKYQFTVMLLGVCFTILSLLIIGPSELLPFLNPGLATTSVGMILMGIGTG